MTFAEEFPMLENAEGAIIGVTSDGPFTAYTTKEIEKACLDKERVRQAIENTKQLFGGEGTDPDEWACPVCLLFKELGLEEK
jgi:hypothetical protein